MSVSDIVEQITNLRELIEEAGEDVAAARFQRLEFLQQELTKLVPTSASEAFMMATELTYMLEGKVERQRAALVARSLTNGLMALSKQELVEAEGADYGTNWIQ